MSNPVHQEKVAHEEVHIEVKRKRSSTDTVRRNSDTRLIGTADLEFAKKVDQMQKHEGGGHEGVIGIPDEADLDKDALDSEEPFEFSHGITQDEADKRLKIYGPNKLPEKKIPKWYIFVQQLWQPMPIMIWLAAFVEAGIQNFLDMGILFLIQFANASIGFYEITKAGDAIEALKKSLEAKATVKRDGVWKNISAELVVPGDMVLLACGSAIPADCRINEGQIEVDQAALTGESLPVTMYKGDSCKMGSTVVRGEVEGTVEFTGADTFFGKTAALLKDSSEYSNLQKLLMSIIVVLVIISLVLCAIVLIYLLVKRVPTEEALSFVVVLLVASIPLAIEIVTTCTLALGSKVLSHEGAIVARLAAIEDLAGMSILCSDKTGTLTLNKMVIQEETPIYVEGESQYSLLRYAAMAAKWKEPPRDALDTLTLTAVDMPSMDAVEQLDFMPFDPIVKRTEGTVKEIATGKVYKTTKGAPHVILKLVLGCGADHSIADKVEHDVHNFGLRGIRSLAVAKTDENGTWQMLGLLTFLDPPRPDTKSTIENANANGVAVKMITGDHLLIAKETCKVLEMGDYVKSADGLPMLDPVTKEKPQNLARDYGDMCLAADAFAQVFPEHKYLIVECLREMGYKVGMTGDGVNDAPALKRADVGIAVQGATDAARAAADIVLTQPGLSTIVHGIVVARQIFKRIQNFVTYRIAATLQLLVFFFIAVFAFKPAEYRPKSWGHESYDASGAPNQFLRRYDSPDWPEFFHMPVLMLMLITLLNDGTMIAIGYDNVEARKMPEKWNLKVLFLVSSILGAVACISSLALLHWLLDSWNHPSLFQGWGLGGISYGQVTTSIYLKVSVSDFLTLFSARTGEKFFFQVAPSPLLLGAGFIALLASTILATAWPVAHPDGILAVGLGLRKPYALAFYIWVYCIVWWWIQDAIKVGSYWVIRKFNIFGYMETGQLVLPESTVRYIQENKEADIAKANKPGGHH